MRLRRLVHALCRIVRIRFSPPGAIYPQPNEDTIRGNAVQPGTVTCVANLIRPPSFLLYRYEAYPVEA